jgi:hypothetical protein
MTADQTPPAAVQIAIDAMRDIPWRRKTVQEIVNYQVAALARADMLCPAGTLARLAALEAVAAAGRSWQEQSADRGREVALRRALSALDATPAGTTTEGLRDVRVSEIRPGVEWLLNGGWVLVVDTTMGHPDDRVTVTYEQDGERDTTREYHGYERAAVRYVEPGVGLPQFCP